MSLGRRKSACSSSSEEKCNIDKLTYELPFKKRKMWGMAKDPDLLGMMSDSSLCPSESMYVVSGLCKILNIGPPNFFQVVNFGGIGSMLGQYQVCCEISALMTSAVGSSLEEATHGAAFRMIWNMIPFLNTGELAAFFNLTIGIDKNENETRKIGLTEMCPFLKELVYVRMREELGEEVNKATESAVTEPEACSTSAEPKVEEGGISVTAGEGCIGEEVDSNTEKQVEVIPASLVSEAGKFLTAALNSGDRSNCNQGSPKDGNGMEQVPQTRAEVDYVSHVKMYCDRLRFKELYEYVPDPTSKEPYFEARLTIDRSSMNLTSVEALGFGRTKKQAKKCAAQIMMSKLQTCGQEDAAGF